jgi:hypothetical protein
VRLTYELRGCNSVRVPLKHLHWQGTLLSPVASSSSVSSRDALDCLKFSHRGLAQLQPSDIRSGVLTVRGRDSLQSSHHRAVIQHINYIKYYWGRFW